MRERSVHIQSVFVWWQLHHRRVRGAAGIGCDVCRVRRYCGRDQLRGQHSDHRQLGLHRCFHPCHRLPYGHDHMDRQYPGIFGANDLLGDVRPKFRFDNTFLPPVANVTTLNTSKVSHFPFLQFGIPTSIMEPSLTNLGFSKTEWNDESNVVEFTFDVSLEEEWVVDHVKPILFDDTDGCTRFLYLEVDVHRGKVSRTVSLTEQFYGRLQNVQRIVGPEYPGILSIHGHLCVTSIFQSLPFGSHSNASIGHRVAFLNFIKETQDYSHAFLQNLPYTEYDLEGNEILRLREQCHYDEILARRNAHTAFLFGEMNEVYETQILLSARRADVLKVDQFYNEWLNRDSGIRVHYDLMWDEFEAQPPYDYIKSDRVFSAHRLLLLHYAKLYNLEPYDLIPLPSVIIIAAHFSEEGAKQALQSNELPKLYSATENASLIEYEDLLCALPPGTLVVFIACYSAAIAQALSKVFPRLVFLGFRAKKTKVALASLYNMSTTLLSNLPLLTPMEHVHLLKRNYKHLNESPYIFLRHLIMLLGSRRAVFEGVTLFLINRHIDWAGRIHGDGTPAHWVEALFVVISRLCKAVLDQPDFNTDLKSPAFFNQLQTTINATVMNNEENDEDNEASPSESSTSTQCSAATVAALLAKYDETATTSNLVLYGNIGPAFATRSESELNALRKKMKGKKPKKRAKKKKKNIEEIDDGTVKSDHDS